MWIIWEAEHEIFLVFVSGNGYLGIFHALNTPFEYMKRKLIPYITKDQSRGAFINKKYPKVISFLHKWIWSIDTVKTINKLLSS